MYLKWGFSAKTRRFIPPFNFNNFSISSGGFLLFTSQNRRLSDFCAGLSFSNPGGRSHPKLVAGEFL